MNYIYLYIYFRNVVFCNATNKVQKAFAEVIMICSVF